MSESKLGTISVLSLGIGGMVGGGIFAVTGLAIELTRGAAPVAFIVAGVVALLTSYSYWRLSLATPNRGGTVYFLNKAFGGGVLTGALNILLCMSYIVLISIYAYAFGAYGAKLFNPNWYPWLIHVLMSGVIVVLALMNFFGPSVVIKSENFFNLTKIILLLLFVVWGLSTPIAWERLEVAQWVDPLPLISGAMIIFLNYEGFELIANAGDNIKNPRRALPIGYMGGVCIVMALYFVIATVVIGHMDFKQIQLHSDYVLSAAADDFMGKAGVFVISFAALLATSSAINASFYGSGRLTYTIAKSGELPDELERKHQGMPIDGLIIFSVFSLITVNLVPLSAIAVMGSAGFLIIFMMANLANFKLYQLTHSIRAISLLGAVACGAALIALLHSVFTNHETRWHFYILISMITLAFLIEIVYRKLSGRGIYC